MSLAVAQIFPVFLGLGQNGVTGKSSDLSFVLYKITRASSPTISTVSTGGGITIGSVNEVGHGGYCVGVTGLAHDAYYFGVFSYTGDAGDVDFVDQPTFQGDFSAALPASVLPGVAQGNAGSVLTAGTGTAQFDVSGGVGKANKVQMNGTSIAGTGTRIADNFVTMYNAATANFTVASVNQTGDSFARLGAPAGASLAADVAGVLTAVQNVQNNTFISDNVPYLLERPDSSSESITWTFIFADETGTAKNLDSGNPTITLVNAAGTDRSSRLGSWSNPSTGVYTIVYTNSASDGIENLSGQISGTVNSKLRKKPLRMQIVDITAVDFTSTDRTNLGTILTAVNAYLTGDAFVRLGAPAGGSHAADVAAVYSRLGAPSGASLAADTAAVKAVADAVKLQTDKIGTNSGDSSNAVTAQTSISSLVSSLSSLAGKFAGITLIANWLRAIARKGNNDATAVSEINANNGTGTGTFDPTTDSEEAIRDRGDLAWTTGEGGGGGGDNTEILEQLDEIQAKTDLIGSATWTVISPVAEDGSVTIWQGDDYLTEDGRAIEFSNEDYTGPSLDGATVQLELYRNPGVDRSRVTPSHTFEGEIATSDTQATATFNLTNEDTAAVRAHTWHYLIVATTSDDHVVTLQAGTFKVI